MVTRTAEHFLIHWHAHNEESDLEPSFITENRQDFFISLSGNEQYWENDDFFVLFSGYQLIDIHNKEISFLKDLAYKSLSERKEWLRTVSGYFVLVIINKKSAEIFSARDKYGCFPLYFSINQSGEISNSLALISLVDNTQFDPQGLYESIYYRWLSGSKTLQKNVQQLPASHLGIFTDYTIELSSYWHWRSFEKKPNQQIKFTFNELIAKLEHHLDQYFKTIEPQVKKVLIPLSGGVDSSLLAAKAQQHLGSKCIAGIISFDGDNNPELEMAKYFAETIGMEYRIIHFSNNDVIEASADLVNSLEHLPRHYSSMPFAKLLNHSNEFDAVIYGEPGDTFFGSHTIKRLLTRFERMRVAQKIPTFLIKYFLSYISDSVSSKLLKLKKDSIHELFHNADKIYFPECDSDVIKLLEEKMEYSLDIDKNLNLAEKKIFLSLSKSCQLSQLKNYMLITDITDHLVTANQLIINKKVKLLTPLTYSPIEELSWQLGYQDYIGKAHVKILLRELGCKFYSRESMFAPKYGFNTPREDWIKILLPIIIDKLKGGQLLKHNVINQGVLNKINKYSCEMIWTLYHLEIYLEKFMLNKVE